LIIKSECLMETMIKDLTDHNVLYAAELRFLTDYWYKSAEQSDSLTLGTSNLSGLKESSSFRGTRKPDPISRDSLLKSYHVSTKVRRLS